MGTCCTGDSQDPYTKNDMMDRQNADEAPIDKNSGKQSDVEPSVSNTNINIESQSDIPTLSDAPTTPEVLNMDRKTMQLLMEMDDILLDPPNTLNLNIKHTEASPAADILGISPSVKRLSSHDRNLHPENERLDVIANVATFDELQNVIGKNYDTDGSESDHSDLCEEDKLEIERVKSNEKKPMNWRNLAVAEEETYELEEFDEMKQELLNLARHASGDKIRELQHNKELSDEILFALPSGGEGDMELAMEDGDELDLPDSNLFRDASGAVWDNPLIDKTKKEMTRQMLMLASQNRTFHND